MNNLLIRAGMSPLDNFDANHILNHNSIGENVGNLIYAYSVYKTLMTDSVDKITPNYYASLKGKAAEINENYDAFVIPLADAFRADFMPEMRNLTALIKELTIPCIIIGVGLRAPFEPGEKMSYSFDNDIKDFIKAVLEKSAMVGVRGEYTSAYLKSLGFREEIDHTVIGCPSMYTNGPDIKLREVNLTKASRIAINDNVVSPEKVHQFLLRCRKQFPDHYFLPQRWQELQLLYTGIPYMHNQRGTYPTRITDEIYAKDRVKFFLNVSTWMEFLTTMDISVGSRLHGNVVAMVSGTPSVLIPHDARMREVVRYHHLPHINARDISKDTDLVEVVAKLDFGQVARHHQKNFEHYINFLDKNGLDHIYKEKGILKETPLERKLKEIDFQPEVSSVRNCSLEEMSDRLYAVHIPFEKKANSIKLENVKLKENISKLERKNRVLNSENKDLKKENEELKSSGFSGTVRRVARKVKKVLNP